MPAKSIEIFVITFLAYTAIHFIRTSYSFVKSDLPDATGYDIKAIGIVDALMLIFLGIGHFVHAIFPIKKPVQSLWIGLLACSISMGIFAICFNVELLSNFWILAVLMCFNGYMQSYTWPMLLMIIHSHFDPQKYSLLLGFWSTNANFGNIIGFGISKLILSYGSTQWTLVIAVSGLYTSIFALIIFFRFKQLTIETDVQTKVNQSEGVTGLQESVLIFGHQSVTKTIKQRPQIKDPALILLTIIFSLTKSVIYGILLWLPLYFKSSDQLKHYAAEIPITYDSAAIVGSIFLGQMFKKVSNKGFLLNPFMIVLLVCFVVLRYFNLGVIQHFFIISIVGFCLGGTFNTLSGLIVMELVKLLPPALKTKRLGFYSAVTMGVANFTTAFTQVLIGFVIGKDDEKKIFVVFIIYAAVSVGCLMLLTGYILAKKKQAKDTDKDSYKQIE